MSVLVASKLLLAVSLLTSGAKVLRPVEKPVSAAETKADQALSAAKENLAKLKADPARRKFRHEWQNVARALERVGTKYEKSDRAPEAFCAAGDANLSLYKFSSNPEDQAAAAKDFEKVAEKWPKSRCAADTTVAVAKPKPAPVAEAQAVKKPSKKTAVAEKAVESKPAPEPVAVEPKARQESNLSDAVADAIRRVGKQAEAEGVTIERAGRRAPVVRDDEPLHEREVDATEEHDAAPVLESLTERLRDVRVGQGPNAPETLAAKARLKKLSKDGAANELTLAEQLGLKVRRVVIDAGHGGHDSGAIGPTGVQEKTVALAIALKLKAKLEAAGLEVLLTRDDDTFVRLEDRTHFANQHKGDLFISVHCNAAPRKALRGIETYTLNTSSDRYAIRLAARENASSEKGVSDLQFILADLATKANTEESDRLASGVQKTLIRNLKPKHAGVRDLGQKEALFFVLLGARMPAILVETAFVSNPEEEKLLSSKEYQDDVATAIADGVQGFLDDRAKVARVD